ncbi:MAG: hypothetical protein E7535_07925 [Ruminococcaceae bacterium]|nr:hypothetical protein [Oscillospiraceae bacterium]
MKRKLLFFLTVILIIIFSFDASAADESIEELFDALSPETVRLMEEFGFSSSLQESFSDISPEKAFSAILKLFQDGVKKPFTAAGCCIGLLLAVTLISGFIEDKSGFFLMTKSISLMCMVFLILGTSADVFTGCCSSLLVTKDFMLVLIPVFAGIVSVSGNPALAVSFNSVAFSFAEAVALLFEGIIPAVLSVLIAIYCAGVINPVLKFDGIGKTVSKALTLFMAFLSGVFVAVLSIRGVIAGAADSVTIRGVRFLIGNTVPVVGSAIGEALNSIVAGIGLIKNTVGVIGIGALLVINLPAVINVILWKASLYFISVCADIFENSEVKGFSDNMSSVLSVILGAVLFTCFVFIISIAILITISRS